jgi:hypothetical protein
MISSRMNIAAQVLKVYAIPRENKVFNAQIAASGPRIIRAINPTIIRIAVAVSILFLCDDIDEDSKENTDCKHN